MIQLNQKKISKDHTIISTISSIFSRFQVSENEVFLTFLSLLTGMRLLDVQLYFQFIDMGQQQCQWDLVSAIQLMQSTIDIISNLSNKIIIENPEVEENRCRICYEQTKPLITLCECSGTIAYVHEECILDWITKKMETSDVVQIPKCEICRATYSAKLKIGRKKVCRKVLMKKIMELKLIQFLTTLFFLVGTIIAIYLSSTMIFYLFSLPFTSNNQPATANEPKSNLFMEIFTRLIFPLYFMKASIDHGKKRMKLWEESMVQVVELTLNPRLIIKQLSD